MSATLAVSAVPGTGPEFRDDAASRIAALEEYWNGRAGGYDSSVRPPFGHGGVEFYDDNEWIGLALVRAHEVLGDPSLLTQAERVFDFVEWGWDRSPGQTCPGGVFWNRDPRNADRNTVSTANGALLALELYRATANPHYLRWGSRMYRWVTHCLQGSDGLYADHFDGHGTVDGRTWSYNQGAMIGTAVRLYQVTGRRMYLQSAQRLARAALAHYTADRFAGEPGCFVAIFFRNLGLLSEVAPDPAYRAVEQSYADSLWRSALDAHTGVVAESKLLDQAALVQLYAQLAAA